MENSRIAIHESKDSEKVIKFINTNELTEEMVKFQESGWLWGLCYDEDGKVVAVDNWGETHENVLKV